MVPLSLAAFCLCPSRISSTCANARATLLPRALDLMYGRWPFCHLYRSPIALRVSTLILFGPYVRFVFFQ